LHLPRAGLTNRPATIIDIDARKGIYKVKYANGDLDQWLPARLLGGCQGVAAAPITRDYFAGARTGLSGCPTVRSRDIRRHRQYEAPDLGISYQGTRIP
jgi:hypothetical protein